MNDTFRLWARPTPGGFQMVHTSVTTANQEFNCFGDPLKPGDRSESIGTATGSEKWAKMVYGPYAGQINAGFPCGLFLQYTGRCQSVANRVLALTREGIDARGAFGNGAVILIYGKYGFCVQDFILSVQKSGAQLLQSDPGEITQADIDAAVSRLTQGQTATEELDVLHADVQKQFGISLPAISEDQRAKFCAVYSKYQADREAAFRSIVVPAPQNIEQQLVNALKAPWSVCCDGLQSALGPEGLSALLGVTPDKAKQVFNYY